MEFLYDAGVDLECIDSSGRLPIHLAALHGGTVLYNLLCILPLRYFNHMSLFVFYCVYLCPTTKIMLLI